MQNLLEIIEVLKTYVPAVVAFLFGIGIIALLKKSITKAREIDSGKIVAKQLGGLLIVITTIVTITVVLPINQSMKGQILSFFGMLITGAIAFSSTTFIGNAMAGLMLKSFDNLRYGAFIKIGEIEGRITELDLLHTEIQTQNRDLITLSNLYVLNTPYKISLKSGTFISCEVSLGYDVSMNDIKAAMLDAVESIGLTDGFVSVLSLGDYSILYKANGFLKDTKLIVSTRTLLNTAIVQKLHENNIEIVSPTFMNQRVFSVSKNFMAKEKAQQIPSHEKPADEKIFDKAEVVEGVDLVIKRFEETKQIYHDLKVARKSEKITKEQERLDQEILEVKTEIKNTAQMIEKMKDEIE
jgi:small conductance mechanosensitive channel